MDLPREDELAQTYRSASDNELLDLALAYGSLTDVAQSALRAEFERRGLEPPVIPDEPRLPEFQKLVTVQQYRDLAEAQVAKGVLDSAGIPCCLRDENTVRLEWVWSNLLGGVRLQVNEQDLEAARAVLMQPIPEQIQLDGDLPYDQPRCPRCGSLDIHYQAIHERAGLASIILFVPVPIPKHAWLCEDCGAQWRKVPDDGSQPYPSAESNRS
jgi:Putative prokaryotic signal transducing protein